MNKRQVSAAERLEREPIAKLLWWSCSQTTFSVGVYGIYALTNAWFVARGVGPDALAAVNLAAPLLLFLGAISTTLGVGAASVVSRSLGNNRPEHAARATGNAIVFFLLAALVVTVVGLIFHEPILRLLGADETTMPFAKPYAVILLCGSVFSTGFSAIVRAEGSFSFSVFLWLVPVVCQVVLDPLLIFVLNLGVSGAALGTVGGQMVSAGMAFWFFFLKRKRPYRLKTQHLRIALLVIGPILSIGAPSFLAGLGVTALVALVNAQLAAFGVATVAAYAVCARMQTFLLMPQNGITQGVQPIVSFNRGRGRTDRVDHTMRLALAATSIYGIAAAALVALTAPWIVGVFVQDDELLALGSRSLTIVSIGLVFSGVPQLISAYFQAIGRPAASYVLSIGTVILLKIPLVIALVRFGPTGIWMALPLGEAASAAVALLLLRKAHRREGWLERNWLVANGGNGAQGSQLTGRNGAPDLG
ncbi:MATE family efflux transporter [Populibacterium corticicola]|uniref:Multidrug export protein MepA n=1 Tax=Populibacterium corticicola TaxID=1812826 RepID=A0ABW5XF50_9MICO